MRERWEGLIWLEVCLYENLGFRFVIMSIVSTDGTKKRFVITTKFQVCDEYKQH